MAASSTSADSVRVTLSLDDPSRQDIPFPVRELTLDKDNKSIVVGRASKVETKGLVSLPDNAWFLSPVISRKHAEISANIDDKKVMITDIGSLHGTFLNGNKDKLPKNEPRELKHGDKVQLGVSIYRGNDMFPPTTVGVSIVHANQEVERDECPTTTTFQVPDCSDVEDYSSDDSSDLREVSDKTLPTLPRIKLGSTPAVAIDLTQPPQSGAPRNPGVFEVIDLSDSPPQSPGSPLSDVEDDSISIAEVPALIPDNTDLPPSSSADSPDLSTASPELSATITCLHDLTNLNSLTSLSGLTNLNGKYNDSELSDVNSSIQLSTDDEDMSSDDGYGSDDTNSERSVDGKDDDADDNRSVLSDEVDHLQSEEESILAHDNDDLDMDEDAEFDVDYSSEDEGSDHGFPDEVFKSAFWEEVPFEQTAKPHPQPSVNEELPKGPNPSETLSFETMSTSYARLPEPTGSKRIGYNMTPVDHLANAGKGAAILTAAPVDPPSNASKGAGIVTIKKLLNDEKASAHHGPNAESSLPEGLDITMPTPVFFAPREPSPSDAAMPKSCHVTSTEKHKTTAEVLGDITGKGEFFAAREENKVLSKTFKPAEPRFTPSVHAICNSGVGAAASAGCGPFTLGATPTAGRFSKKMPQKASENAYMFPDVNWAPEDVEAFFPRSIPKQAQPEAELELTHRRLLQEWTSGRSGPQSITFARLGGVEDQSSRRTHLGISDIVDGCQQTTAHSNEKKATEEPVGKGKRKAGEISESVVAEERWAQLTDSLPKETSAPPGPIQETPAAQEASDEPWVFVEEPEKTVASISRDINDRPTKRLRHIAERFGYAALGGVTAGAMIFGTLVYTAPTFV